MIVGEAFKRLFNGLTADFTVDGNAVQDWAIKYHYGDQKELIKWISDTKAKYPLVWYVKNPYTERNGVYYVDNAQLIILQQTKVDWFNNEKFVRTYNEIIDPVWEIVKNTIEDSLYVYALRNNGDPIANKYRNISDEPSYGVPSPIAETGNNVNKDFTKEGADGNQSIVQDFVDAKIINLNIRIQPECII